jgi:signal transduction histidine kinase
VQARTRELQESLEYQTATSDVLGVIAKSPSEVQPVFDMIAESAMRLCQSNRAAIFRRATEGFHAVSLVGNVPDSLREDMRSWVIVADHSSIAGRVALEGQTVHVHDVWNDPASAAVPESAHDTRRTVLGVPLLSEGIAQGVIVLTRSIVKPFTERQIELVKIFADQAVIAIENARLFEEVQARTRELQQSLEYQTATSDVLEVISRSPTHVQPVLDTIAMTGARLCEADHSIFFNVKGDKCIVAASNNTSAEFIRYLVDNPVPLSKGSATARAALQCRTIHVGDVLAWADWDNEHRAVQPLGRQRTVLSAPLMRDGRAIGVLTMMRSTVRPFSERQVKLAETFADQAVIAIENTRLFEEVQARTRELAKTIEDLEIASQHKSQFVANMSHELRTPLAAILGYAELMQEGFYEPLGQKSLDALTRIRSNGKHLLGLINTVLDIAKIESGQFSLNLTEYSLESVIDAVRGATESLAQSKKLAFKAEVAKPLPVGIGDEQRLTQVLLNLAGNAIKFTDTGEVCIHARTGNGCFAVSVSDTGPGIPEEHQGRIFEQFHQVDSSNTKAKGGTGLGLAIAKQIVEMHGGRIWVESTPGRGSTFKMELPVRATPNAPVST